MEKKGVWIGRLNGEYVKGYRTLGEWGRRREEEWGESHTGECGRKEEWLEKIE